MNSRSKTKHLPAHNGTAHASPPQPAPRRGVAASLLACALLLTLVAATPPKETGKRFPNPDAAVDALATAANAHDVPALSAIFGPAFSEICSPDPTQRENELEEFTNALNQAHRTVNNGDAETVLELGTENWPFPIPIVKRDGQWFFDTDAGKQEIINRRIGRNELSAIKTVRAYVEAQREYAMHDHDRDSVLEYAQKLASSPGQKDGLYWSPELDGEISPLGPLVAAAQAEGYAKKVDGGGTATAQPFQGYNFKTLTRQGKDAPGGQYDYIINGNMIGGFALVAYPSDYGESGIMTFIVNQQGRVYEKDLGPDTAKAAGGMSVYNPDKTWKPSRD